MEKIVEKNSWEKWKNGEIKWENKCRKITSYPRGEERPPNCLNDYIKRSVSIGTIALGPPLYPGKLVDDDEEEEVSILYLIFFFFG